MANDHVKWQGELPLGAQHNREVFARFGLAMYYAHCLESQIGLLLATKFNQKFLQATPEQRDAIFKSEAKKTLGCMVRDLGNKAHLSTTLKSRLREAVELRNWLAHRYFWDRARKIKTLEGREQMIFELQEKADFFKELDREFTELLFQWFYSMGGSKEEFELELAKFVHGNFGE